ncbi:MAG TPA: hypothetical protein VFT45_07655 [Longimicrobium sp.]|nr:hypothetical protein [Longimicrobium sp.]
MLASAAVLVAGLSACEKPPVRGQFGTYANQNKVLWLANGDSFTVYRVSYVQFSGGDPPAVQLEYAPHGTVQDTMRMWANVHAIWPSFATYLDAARVEGAIITATNLQVRRKGISWVSSTRSYGITASRGPDGRWYLDRMSAGPLPPADPAARPIVEATGAPFTPADLRRYVDSVGSGGATEAAR